MSIYETTQIRRPGGAIAAQNINVRFPPALVDAIAATAESQGMTMASWISWRVAHRKTNHF
jgi:predicted HicB family RNase H-like nuclease